MDQPAPKPKKKKLPRFSAVIVNPPLKQEKDDPAAMKFG